MSDGAGADLKDFHRRWPTLRPPLRPHADVARAIAALLPVSKRPTLLLGVTPELATIARDTIAIDWSARMATGAWLGNTLGRKLVLGDWRSLPLADASIGAAIGDGSLTMLGFPDEVGELLAHLKRTIAPGGRAILRCFATPEPAEPVATVCAAARSGALGFHEFKLRFNMAVAAADGTANVASARLFDAFEAMFADRAALARASGWHLDTIAEIDAYRGSRYNHCYPSRAALLALAAAVGEARFEPSGDYPGAEYCPLLVIDFP